MPAREAPRGRVRGRAEGGASASGGEPRPEEGLGGLGRRLLLAEVLSCRGGLRGAAGNSPLTPLARRPPLVPGKGR
ncbi:MAG TPA: hypothetical protein VH877_02310 [Polyangia bacterium]|nr:hypothetical protein [Polyangia bacterium]